MRYASAPEPSRVTATARLQQHVQVPAVVLRGCTVAAHGRGVTGRTADTVRRVGATLFDLCVARGFATLPYAAACICHALVVTLGISVSPRLVLDTQVGCTDAVVQRALRDVLLTLDQSRPHPDHPLDAEGLSTPTEPAISAAWRRPCTMCARALHASCYCPCPPVQCILRPNASARGRRDVQIPMCTRPALQGDPAVPSRSRSACFVALFVAPCHTASSDCHTACRQGSARTSQGRCLKGNPVGGRKRRRCSEMTHGWDALDIRYRSRMAR